MEIHYIPDPKTPYGNPVPPKPDVESADTQLEQAGPANEPATYTILGLAQAVAWAQWDLNYDDFAEHMGFTPEQCRQLVCKELDGIIFFQWHQFQQLDRLLAACAPWLEKMISK